MAAGPVAAIARPVGYRRGQKNAYEVAICPDDDDPSWAVYSYLFMWQDHRAPQRDRAAAKVGNAPPLGKAPRAVGR